MFARKCRVHNLPNIIDTIFRSYKNKRLKAKLKLKQAGLLILKIYTHKAYVICNNRILLAPIELSHSSFDSQ